MSFAHWRIAGVELTIALHFAWQIAQADLFASFAGAAHDRDPAGILICALATLVDLALAVATWKLVTVIVRRDDWPVAEAKWALPGALWIALGAAITIAAEEVATRIGLWRYSVDMPRWHGVALAPLTQWTVVPLLTLMSLRALRRIGQRPHEGLGSRIGWRDRVRARDRKPRERSIAAR